MINLQIIRCNRGYDLYVIVDEANNPFASYGSQEFKDALYLTKNNIPMRWEDILKKYPKYEDRCNNTEWYSLEEAQKAWDLFYNNSR